jgi:hypothetical protein
LNCATFSKKSVSYLYVRILSCILVTREQHVLSFLCVYFQTNLLTNVKVSVFFFIVPMSSPSRSTSSAWSSSWCVPFNFSPTWFSWTFLMAYSKDYSSGESTL